MGGRGSLEEWCILCVLQGYLKPTLKGIVILIWEAGNVSKGQLISCLAQAHTREPSALCAAEGSMWVHEEELTASTDLGSGMCPAPGKERQKTKLNVDDTFFGVLTPCPWAVGTIEQKAATERIASWIQTGQAAIRLVLHGRLSGPQQG